MRGLGLRNPNSLGGEICLRGFLAVPFATVKGITQPLFTGKTFLRKLCLESHQKSARGRTGHSPLARFIGNESMVVRNRTDLFRVV